MKEFLWYQAGITFFVGMTLMAFSLPSELPTAYVTAQEPARQGISLATWGFGFALASFVELVTFSVAHIAKKRM